MTQYTFQEIVLLILKRIAMNSKKVKATFKSFSFTLTQFK